MSWTENVVVIIDDESEREETTEPSIKAILRLDYPDGQTISEEIGEITTLPPEPYDQFVVDLAQLLRDAADAFEAAHAQAKAEEEQQ